MNNFDFKKIKGFSIVELLVYVSIFSIVAVVVVNSLIISTKSFAETRTNRVLLHGGLDIMERITREIQNANTVSVETDFGVNGGELVLNKTDEEDNDIETKFVVENNSIVFYEDDISIGVISSNEVGIESLIFRDIVTTGAEAVRVELVVEDLGGQDNRTANFYNTIILRGSYE